MKKLIPCAVLVAALAIAQISSACVGRTIFLGVTNAANEKLLADMASIMITERTGSSVKIQVFKDSKELYDAVKAGKISFFIESTDHAMEVVGKPKHGEAITPYQYVKGEYRKELGLVWLEPFDAGRQYAPVLTTETLSNYPALPKLLNKLSGVLSRSACARLLRSADSDAAAKKVARDFLKGKKLI